MKRASNRKAAVNHELHRMAFEHAFRMFGKPRNRSSRSKTTHTRQHRRIRFWVDLELEKGGTIEAEFTCTRGFRIEQSLGLLWERTPPLKPESSRHLPHRLKAYQDKLHAWNKAGGNPLTFRSFSLLLAAISYDVANP